MNVPREALATLRDLPEYQAGQMMLHQMLARSASDPFFRQQLLTAPTAAIAAFYEEQRGEAFPEAWRRVDIRFIESRADVTLVLPDPVDREAELSDEDLEAVAGGAIIPATLTPTITTSSSFCVSLSISVGASMMAIEMANK